METENRIILKGGYINTVYYENNAVVKQYDEHEAITTPAKTRFDREVDALSKFGGILAPRLLSHDDISMTISMEFVQGKNIRYILENGSSEQEKINFVEKTAEAALSLHSHEIEVDINTKSNYIQSKRKTALQNYYYLISSGIAKEAKINTDFMQWRLIRRDIPAITRAVNSTNTFSYLHGDFWLNNLMGDQETGQFTGIIDWEYAHYGMRQEDLAQIMMWDFREREYYIPFFFQKYGPVPGIDAFIFTTALEYATSGSLENYQSETNTGFMKTHTTILNEMLS